MSEEEDFLEHGMDKKPQNKIIWAIWNAMFVLFYPVLAAFSLVMMILMFVSSTLSRIVIWIAAKFKRQN